jgi:hypothetical protein
MSNSKTARNAKQLFSIGSVILLITIFGLYGAYYSARVSNFGPIADNSVKWQSAETEGGLATLHPEQHIFRDAKTIRMKWNITTGQRAPDGVTKPVYLINGECRRKSRVKPAPANVL